MPQSHNPIRCFDGNAQPHQPFWQWVNAENADPELVFDGVISEYSWLGDEITPKLFRDELYKNGKGGPITMKINSPGGDVVAASHIRSIMTEYPGAITAQIEGIAASAAVIVAISAKTVNIMDSAYMMIHDPAVVVFMAQLDIETLTQLRDSLKSIKDGILPAYVQRTGLTEGVLSNMMSNETWMSAREAVEYGFADGIITGGQSPAQNIFQNVAYVNVLNSFQNVPPALLNSSSEPQESPVDVERESRLARLRERIKS